MPVTETSKLSNDEVARALQWARQMHSSCEDQNRSLATRIIVYLAATADCLFELCLNEAEHCLLLENGRVEHAETNDISRGRQFYTAIDVSDFDSLHDSLNVHMTSKHYISTDRASFEEISQENKQPQSETGQSALLLSLADLINSKACSVRLKNCSRHDYFDRTSVGTALADRTAMENNCLQVQNFGRGSLYELNKLLDEWTRIQLSDGNNSRSQPQYFQNVSHNMFLSELIRVGEPSVRLANCSRHELFLTTTIHAALADRNTFNKNCLRIINFGKGTLDEINILLDRIANLTEGFDVRQERAKALTLCQEFFEDVTLHELCNLRPLSVRLSNGLAVSPFRNSSLSALIQDWPLARNELKQQKNMGIKSVLELEEICKDFVKRSLIEIGFSNDNACELVHCLLANEAPPLSLISTVNKLLSTSSPASVRMLYDQKLKTPDEFADELLTELSERSQTVVRKRYGLGDQVAQTLEEIAKPFGITRERVRQLEAKALKKLRVVGKLLPLKATLLEHSEDVWAKLVSPFGIVRREDIENAAIRPTFKFLLHIADWSLEEWLDECAQRWRSVWVWHDLNTGLLDEAAEILADQIDGKPLPRPLDLTSGGLEPKYLDAVLGWRTGLVRNGCYIYSRDQRQRSARRAALLHSSFSSNVEPQNVHQLAADIPAGVGQHRYVSSIAAIYPHLFLEADDGFWYSIGTPSSYPSKNLEDLAHLRVQGSSKDLDGSTTAALLTKIMELTGPLRLSELYSIASKRLPRDRSAASIAPTLMTNRDIFERPLPGVYGLKGAVPFGEALLGAPPEYLINVEQARFFALGRRAGEPWGSYGLWTIHAEYALCRWAREHASSDLLDSLLAVASVDEWPIDDVAKLEWKAFCHQKARVFRLHFVPDAESGYVLPKADRFLAACLQARHVGSFNWMVGNRVLNKMVSSKVSTGLLALMCSLGALQARPASDWQMSHECGTNLSNLIDLLSRELHDNGHLSWTYGACSKLIKEVDVSVASHQSWIDPRQLEDMLSGHSNSDETDVEVDMDELNRLIAIEADKLDWEFDDVASAPLSNPETAIGSEYRPVDVGNIKLVSDQDGRWTLDDI